MLWAALALEITFVFNYGDYYDWWSSPVIRMVSISASVTFVFCLGRMFSIRHPYLEPKMWTYRYLAPILVLVALVEMWTYRYLAPILVLVALVEMLLATEHVLEETFLEGVMHYGTMTGVQLDWPVLAGCLAGCLFSYWWMHVKRFNYLRLIIIGLAGVICYLLGFYFTVSSDIHISQLCLPMACRGFGYAVLSVTFLTC